MRRSARRPSGRSATAQSEGDACSAEWRRCREEVEPTVSAWLCPRHGHIPASGTLHVVGLQPRLPHAPATCVTSTFRTAHLDDRRSQLHGRPVHLRGALRGPALSHRRLPSAADGGRRRPVPARDDRGDGRAASLRSSRPERGDGDRHPRTGGCSPCRSGVRIHPAHQRGSILRKAASRREAARVHPGDVDRRWCGRYIAPRGVGD